MPEIKTRRELSIEAERLAVSFECVRYNGVTYIPADYETRDTSVTPAPERKIWIPFTRLSLQQMAAVQFNTLFNSDSELANFEFMVAQCSTQHHAPATSLLIKTFYGLRELKEDGKLHEVTGAFIPNALPVQLNDNEDDKAEVMCVLEGWLNSEEEAIALLRHMATALAPGWSAVKYVLLLGDGRNGKSVLLGMLESVLGLENRSSVSRQEISEKSPVVTELLGKLVNIIYDGVAVYLKDSGHEKSLIAGEPVGIRKLYSSEQTVVQTNALFMEGLNREPKSSDKSSALQARITRFWFPNTYPDDLIFRERMLSEKILGAFLSLLIDNYVKKVDKAVMLAPTSTSLALQLDHMLTNSLGLQFVSHIDTADPLGVESLLDITTAELTSRFQSWRIKEGDITVWSEPDVVELFRPVLVTERKSKRISGDVKKVRIVTELKKETLLFVESLKGEEDDSTVTVVEN